MTKSLVIDGLSTIDLSTFNEDWLGWPDAPGGKDHEPYGEDVDFAQAQMVAECAETKLMTEDEWYDEEAASAYYEGWCSIHQCVGHECACAWERRETLATELQCLVEDISHKDAEASWYRFMVA